jgi:hypothetical protein
VKERSSVTLYISFRNNWEREGSTEICTNAAKREMIRGILRLKVVWNKNVEVIYPMCNKEED